MARNIIDLICNSCSCGKEEAQEYLDDEIRNLQELQADNDLRGEDFEIACSNLGLDQDCRYISSTVLQDFNIYNYDLFSEHTITGGPEKGIPPSGNASPPGQGW